MNKGGEVTTAFKDLDNHLKDRGDDRGRSLLRQLLKVQTDVIENLKEQSGRLVALCGKPPIARKEEQP